jgi:hypothetical protein
MVVPANVWDSMFGADYLKTEVVEISGDSTAADNLEADYDGTGYAKTASTTKLHADYDAAKSAAPTAAAIADAVWDEVVTTGAHDTATYAGAGLLAAASAGDPWATALPGSYGSGTAGKIIGDNINAPIGTVDTVVDGIATQIGTAGAGLTAVPWNAAWDAEVQSECADAITAADFATDAEVAAAVRDVSNATPAAGSLGENVAAILTDTSTTLDGKLDTIDDFLDTEVAAIKAKTDNLPASPAAVGSQMDLVNAPNATAVTAIQSGLATAAALDAVDNFVDTEVAAIKAVTDKLDTAVELDVDVYRFTTNALEQASGTGATAQQVWEYATRTITALDEDDTTLDLDATIAAAVPTAAAIADAVWDEASTDHTDAGKAGAQLWTDVDAILADTNELQTNQGNWATATGFSTHDAADVVTALGTGSTLSAVPWNADWDAEVQSECADALNSYDPPTKTEMDGAFTVIKGATWDSGTDTLEAIYNKASDIMSNMGDAGGGLRGIPWNAAWDDDIQSECTNALNAYDPPTKAELDASDDAILAVLGTAAGASIAADIAAVKAETAAIVEDTGTTLDTLIKDIPTNSELATALASADDAVLAAITALTEAGFKKNTAVTGFTFYMTDSTDHVAAMGLTVTAERSLDGGEFAACANAVEEVSDGCYKITLAQADTNGDMVTLKFTATGADDLVMTVKTSA